MGIQERPVGVFRFIEMAEKCGFAIQHINRPQPQQNACIERYERPVA